MRKNYFRSQLKANLIVLFFFLSCAMFAQYQTTAPKSQSDFWKNVQYGGSIGLSFGNDYTEIAVSPTAIYNVNPTVAVGLSLQGSYVNSNHYYTSSIYGASIIGLINPIPQIQFSAELIEAHVSNEYEYIDGSSFHDDFWNTALLIGGGFRSGNVTVGVTYNVLYDSNKDVYGDAVMPFVRAYF